MEALAFSQARGPRPLSTSESTAASFFKPFLFGLKLTRCAASDVYEVTKTVIGEMIFAHNFTSTKPEGVYVQFGVSQIVYPFLTQRLVSTREIRIRELKKILPLHFTFEVRTVYCLAACDGYLRLIRLISQQSFKQNFRRYRIIGPSRGPVPRI